MNFQKREFALDRREFLKTTIRRMTALGGISLLGVNPLYAKPAYNVGDITVTWAGIFLYYLPLEIAKEKGFLEEEGIKIGKIFTSKGGATTVRNIVDGGLPFGECSADSATMAIVKVKEPFKLVAGGVKSPGSLAWVARPDSPIKKIQDLKGKTVCFTSPGSVSEALIALCLEAAPGIKPADVKRVAAGGVGPGYTLLEKGEIDAAFTLEPTTSTKGTKFRILFYAREFAPDYFQTFWMARESFLKSHPDVMRGFLRARAKAVKFILEKPEEAANILIKTNEVATTMKLAMTTLKEEGAITGEYYSDNRFIKKGLDLVEKGMRIVGSIAPDAKIPWAEIIDQGYIEEAKRIKLP